MPERPIVRVAVPVPLRRAFDYAIEGTAPLPGTRVRVPFGRRDQIGVVLGTATESAVPAGRLKPLRAVLDAAPVVPETILQLLSWAADYYHHPIGEVVVAALPALLREGRAATAAGPERWQLTAAGRDAAPPWNRAPLRQRLWMALTQAAEGMEATGLAALTPRWRAILREWEAAGWVQATQADCLTRPGDAPVAGPALSEPQRAAVRQLAHDDGYAASLLFGVTGSGKTEVYLQLVARALAAQRQALVLVPEIGLTPQLVARFRARFPEPIAVLHSGLSDSERLCAWLAARDGRAAIVLGTRSAVFTPLARPGLIIVDEEHDLSYKQQDGFRYHARDVAVMRARREAVPIVLGSATPSLETLHNVRQGRYAQAVLPGRAGGATLPIIRLLDLRQLPVIEGLAQPLLGLLAERVSRGEQSLVFINRRGYAPALMCYDCRWIAPCPRCDAKLTLHRGHTPQLHCHHCGAQQTVPTRCPQCGGTRIHPIGEGTQRVEAALARYLPSARIVRIDRDTTRRKGALANQLAQVHAGEADILVGTQMLSKGHDFPNVTLVAVLNADQGLHSSDFRAPEQLFQQIMQVAGRAGRAGTPGEVYVQTFYPDHALFGGLIAHDYAAYAGHVLTEREHTGLPPFAHLALLRAESTLADAGLRFLARARALALELSASNDVRVMDAVPAAMERRAGRYRAQLLLEAPDRRGLHALLEPWLDAVTGLPEAKRVRWSLDVDPMSLG